MEKNLWQQYNTALELEHGAHLNKEYKHTIVCGMGGSHLAATLSLAFLPELIIHSDYGLPSLPSKDLRKSLVVLVSYSGNTEEVLDSLEEALRHDLTVVIITTGGELLRRATLSNLPHVLIPTTSLQPRDALGYQLRALKAALRTDALPAEIKEPSALLEPKWDQEANHLADHFGGQIGLIYGTKTTRGLAYIWKITLNETGKTPAHYNTFPELNHNELESFGSSRRAKDYAGLILTSPSDHPRIQKRAAITENILHQFFSVKHRSLSAISLDSFFTEITIAQKTALALAKKRNIDPESVPTIEAFKKAMLR